MRSGAVVLRAGNLGFRLRTESSTAAASEASYKTQGSGGCPAAVFMARLRRRRALDLGRHVETAHEAVQSLRSEVSLSRMLLLLGHIE